MNKTNKTGAQTDYNITSSLTDLLEGSLLKLHNWVLTNGWAGYDPYDLKNWYLQLPHFLRRIKYIRTIMSLPMRVESHYPYEVQRILGVKQRIYPSAMGLFIESYVRMYKYFGNDEYLQLAKECAHWLIDNVSRGYEGFGWGLPIDWQSRVLIPAGTPCGSVSADCGEGFWRLYEVTGESQYLDICRQICHGFFHSLKIDQLDQNTICFSYTPLDNFHVHNVNLMIAAFIVKIGQHIGESSYLDLGKQAANYALKEQHKDGSLSYWGKDQSKGFQSDHYHSCFDICSLHSLWKLTAREEYYTAVEQYYSYYRNNFLGEEGEPYRNPGDSNLIDIYGCAEAMICNAQLSDNFPQASEILEKVSKWTIENMQSPIGYFIYRIVNKNGKRRRIDVPYIRWGQSVMMRGLIAMLEAFKRNNHKLFNHV